MLSCLASLLLAAAPVDPVVAKVADRPIFASEVEARARGAGAAASMALDDLIGEVLLADAARRDGLEPSKEAEARVEAERRSLAARRLLEQGPHAGAAPTEAQVQEALHAQQDRVRISMLVKRTREEAQAALEKLRAGGSFEEQARTSTEEVSRAKGGALGWMALGSMAPALGRAAAAARPGQLTGPVAVEGGFAVLLVHERQVADDISLALVKDEVRRQLEARSREEAARAYLDGLRKQKGARVDAALLASPGKQKDPVVASAGKVKVRRAEVLAALGPGGPKAPAEMQERMAGRLLDQRLLEAAALEAGMGKAPEVEAGVARVRRAALAEAYLARLRGKLPAPTDQELQAGYRARAAQLQVPGGKPCWRILAASEADARRLRARLQAGEPFAQVARESRDKASAARGGFVGNVTDQEIERIRAAEPALGAALAAAAPGVLGEPVATKGGWELFRCDAPVPARQKTFEEVKHVLAMEVRVEQEQRAIRAKVAELRGPARVWVDEKAVGQLEGRK